VASARGLALRGAGRSVVLAALVLSAGCSAPMLTRDGQLLFTEPGGRRGASVITANGVEFLDESSLPTPVVRRSVSEPWRAPTGFLLPADGVWRETSKPFPIQGRGLGVVVRTSDTLVPSWGGEILLRFDVVAPREAFPEAASSVRPPERVAIVLDGRGANVPALVDVALDDLGGSDRAAIVDTSPARAVVPLVPGANRTLLGAAVQRVVAAPDGARDLPGALALASRWLTADAAPTGVTRHVLVVTDGGGLGAPGLAGAVAELAGRGVRVTGIGAADELSPESLSVLGPDVVAGGAFEDREDAVARALPPPGLPVLEDVVLSVSSAPAPSHVLELSGGTASIAVDRDRLALGDLYVGEARTEVARVSVPAWVAGEPLELEVEATYVDLASGQRLSAGATVPCRYSADVAELAERRHGDVIAYASGLAMVRRLDRAFAGSAADQLGGLRPLVAWQARSLGELARETHDRALGEQAEVLATLLGALRD
jgi:hypothetical protein